jgi:hypothetical protein
MCAEGQTVSFEDSADTMNNLLLPAVLEDPKLNNLRHDFSVRVGVDSPGGPKILSEFATECSRASGTYSLEVLPIELFASCSVIFECYSEDFDYYEDVLVGHHAKLPEGTSQSEGEYIAYNEVCAKAPAPDNFTTCKVKEVKTSNVQKIAQQKASCKNALKSEFRNGDGTAGTISRETCSEQDTYLCFGACRTAVQCNDCSLGKACP